jgi:ankyrin repeat protein
MARSGRPYKVDKRLEDISYFVRQNDWNKLEALFKEFGVDAADEYKRSALVWASFEGNAEFVKKMVQQGADLNHQDAAGLSSLHAAAQNGRIEVAEILLQHGANINIKDEHGNIPLWTALFSYADDKEKMVKLLLKKGADPDLVNNYGRTPRWLMKERLDWTPEEIVKE